jgi:uncharacterized protein
MENMPDLAKARAYVLNRLEHELSPNLTYHCIGHTRDEVAPAADLLATLEKVPPEDHLLLLTGAYFHDLGFIRQRQNHEAVSIQLAEQTLPGFGYSDSQVSVVRGIILATHLPQAPATLLERIMADADMDDLGNESFWKRSQDLRQELDTFGSRFTDEEWYTYQLRLMEDHQYFTASGQSLRNSLKRQHMLEVKQLLNQVIQLK